MLKLAIAATASIALLSAVNTVAAKDISSHKRSSDFPNTLPRITLIARQSPSNVSRSNIKGIDRAIHQYFKDKNNKEISSCQTGGACFFFEVKSLKLVSLSDDNAEILARVASEGYKVERSSSNSSQWSYAKTGVSIPAKIEHMIMLKKVNEEWKVSSSVI